MGRTPVTPTIMGVFKNKPGRKVWLADIQKGNDLNAHQIQSAISRLIKEEEPIEVVVRGQCWKYNGEPLEEAPKPKLEIVERKTYLEIGVTQENHHVLQDEEGKLWLAKRL